MHKKKIDNNLSKTFIQGLRPLANTLPVKLKKILKRNGFNFSSIVDNWTKIVGMDISNNCYPINIKTQNGNKGIVLVLNVIHGREIEVEYNKKNIIDKINSYFGYKYIINLELKIVSIKYNGTKETKLKKKNINNFDINLKKIDNLNLKNKLKKLINAYNEK